MAESEQKQSRNNWVIGGTTMIGLGVGFIYLYTTGSGLIFVASMIIGIGAGLVLEPLIANLGKKE